jgi:hypothetical protein
VKCLYRHHHGCWTVRRRRAACRRTAATINHHRPSNPNHLLLQLYRPLSISHSVNNSLSIELLNLNTHIQPSWCVTDPAAPHPPNRHTANTRPLSHTVPPHRPSRRPRPTNRPRSLSTLRPRCPRYPPLQPIPQHTPQRLTRLLSSRLFTPSGSPSLQLALYSRCPQDEHAASRIRYR